MSSSSSDEWLKHHQNNNNNPNRGFELDANEHQWPTNHSHAIRFTAGRFIRRVTTWTQLLRSWAGLFSQTLEERACRRQCQAPITAHTQPLICIQITGNLRGPLWLYLFSHWGPVFRWILSCSDASQTVFCSADQRLSGLLEVFLHDNISRLNSWCVFAEDGRWWQIASAAVPDEHFTNVWYDHMTNRISEIQWRANGIWS